MKRFKYNKIKARVSNRELGDNKDEVDYFSIETIIEIVKKTNVNITGSENEGKSSKV